MPLLAIESSGSGSSVALAWPDGDEVRIELRAEDGPGLADRLIPLVDRLLAEQRVRYADLDLLAVGTGPGSFTGVRTAIAAARGLALATGREVMAVTTFEALVFAPGSVASAPIVAVLDARRGEVYVQRFGAGLDPEGEPLTAPPEQIATVIGSSCRLVGSGSALVARHLPAAARGAEPRAPDAAGVARAALARRRQGVQPISGFDLRPFYLRAPDARPMRPLLGPGSARRAGA